jgi:hypothetical protein
MERMDYVKKTLLLLVIAGFVMGSGIVGCGAATSPPPPAPKTDKTDKTDK